MNVINLGDQSEREETTKFATEKINLFLRDDEYLLAVLIAHIYTGIRLKTLLIEWASLNISDRKEDSLKKIARVFKDLRFYSCLRNCQNLKLLKDNEFEELKKLNKKRNEAAHETRMWKNKLQSDKENITDVCKFAIKFLEDTNDARVIR